MITIIAGTNRKGSNSFKVAKSYQMILKDRNLKSQIFDLADLPIDFMKNDMYGAITPEKDSIIEKFIKPVSQFVFAIPEYNGTYPGALKLFIDGIDPSHFYHKNAVLVGVATGRAGNIVGLEQFTTVLNHIKMEVLSNKVLLSQVDKLLSADGIVNDQETLKVIEEQIDKMIKTHKS